MGILDGKKGLIIGIANHHSIAWSCAKSMDAAGATLGGTGTVHGAVSVAAGGTLAPGSLNATGTLALASAELDGATLVFDLQAPANGPSDKLAVAGAFNTAAPTALVLNLPAEGLPAGTYTLVPCARNRLA